MNEANLWCPVCDWTEPRTFVAYAVSNAVAAPSVAAALGMPADALLSIHQHQNAKRDEATLKRHQCAEQGEPINLALAREAVVSTALSQGWDLDETRTRTEWEAES